MHTGAPHTVYTHTHTHTDTHENTIQCRLALKTLEVMLDLSQASWKHPLPWSKKHPGDQKGAARKSTSLFHVPYTL